MLSRRLVSTFPSSRRLLKVTWQAPQDHIAVVTGAASGIGKVIALSLLDAGSRVVAVDKQSLSELAREIEEECPTLMKLIVCREADITQREDVASLFDDISTLLGAPPDALCNCAGIARDGWLAKTHEADWDAVMDVNLKGTYMMSKAFLRHRLAAGGEKPGGAIVNISSIVGKAGNLGQTAYAASKAGVIGFTKAAAKELGQYDIRVNAVLPGFINTKMVANVPEKVKSKVLKQITLGAFGEPRDVAQAVLFLCSDSATYLTGTTIEVAGGLWA